MTNLRQKACRVGTFMKHQIPLDCIKGNTRFCSSVIAGFALVVCFDVQATRIHDDRCFGTFEQPSPLKDAASPYLAYGPQYHLEDGNVIDVSVPSHVGWGQPVTPVNGVLRPFVIRDRPWLGPDYAVIADGAGNLATDSTGEFVIDPNGVISEAGWTEWGGSDSQEAAQAESGLSFVGQQFFQRQKGVVQNLGLLTYQNGVTWTGTDISSISLYLQTEQTLDGGPAGLFYDREYDQSLSLKINIVTTPNTGTTPEQNADFIYFPDFPQFGSLRVFEGSSVAIPLLGHFNSLHFDGFGAVVPVDLSDPNNAALNGGFWSPSIGLLGNGGGQAGVPDQGESAGLLLLAISACAVGRSQRMGNRFRA